MDILTSVPSWIWGFLSNHLELVGGYIVGVLFPIPWVNSFIINMWTKLIKRVPATPPAT